MRNKLTNDEFNAVSKLTNNTHLDEAFDVCELDNGDDGFYDFNEQRYVDLETGMYWLYDGLAYPFKHDGMDDKECEVLEKLFIDFGYDTDFFMDRKTIVGDILEYELKDDKTKFGGISFVGEKVKDLVLECGISFDTPIVDFNRDLIKMGILPIEV